MHGSCFQLTAIVAFVIHIYPGLGLQFASYEYRPMKEAVLFFGTHDSSNEAAIQQIASNNSTLITWTVADPITNNKTYFHPILTETDKGTIFINCLFLDSTNSTYDLITDFYMKEMLKSVQVVKLVLLAPLESLKPNNGSSFINLLEWIVRIFPHPEKFGASMILVVTKKDQKIAATVNTTLQLLLDFKGKIDAGFVSHLEALPKVKEIMKMFETQQKIGLSWEPATLLQLLKEIPSTTVLPEDVRYYQSTENSASTISSIVEAEISTFNNAISSANSTMLNIIQQEDNFSSRLESSLKLKKVFENAKVNMMSAKDWKTAAEIMATSFSEMNITLDSSFIKDVSIGQTLLTHVQTIAETNATSLNESFGKTSYDGLIKTAEHYISLYSNFLPTHDEVPRKNKGTNFSDEIGQRQNNLMIESRMASKKLGRNVQTNRTFLQPQLPIPGTNLSTHTVYKIHWMENEDCYLTVRTTIVDDNKVPEPILLCSSEGPSYNTKESSWFLAPSRSGLSGFVLHNLVVENHEFNGVTLEECETSELCMTRETRDAVAEIVSTEMAIEAVVTEKLSQVAQVAYQRAIVMFEVAPLPSNLASMALLGTASAAAEVAAAVSTKMANVAEQKARAARIVSSPSTIGIRNSNESNVVELYIKDSGLSFKPLEDKHIHAIVKGEGPVARLKFELDIQLHTTLTKFNFEKLNQTDLLANSTEVDLADVYTIINNSSATISRDVTVSQTVTDEFSWGFSDNLRIMASVEASIPVVEIGVKAEFEKSSGTHEDHKSTTEKKIQMSYTVNVPANSRVAISGAYSLVKNLKMPYTSDAKITGNGKRISKYDEVVEDTVDSKTIRDFLDRAGFEYRVLQHFNDTLIVRMDGEMTLTAGINGHLRVHGTNYSMEA